MDWKELRIITNHQGIEPLGAMLIANGIESFVINDPDEVRQLESEKSPAWDYFGDEVYEALGDKTYIAVYIADDESGLTDLEAVNASVESLRAASKEESLGPLEIICRSVKDEDWANNWKKYFKPLEIGKRLLIKPSWEELPPDCCRTVITLDPALSFGTGRHDTTRLCLELLEKALAPGDGVCDIGCGSGIIFIAAMLLGAKSASAVDISEDAVRASAMNAEENLISPDSFRVLHGDIVKDTALRAELGSGYDLVAANIVADVLISMKDIFPGLLKPGGRLLVSGIIDSRRDEVIASLENSGFELLELISSNMWSAAVLRHKGGS